MEMNTIANVTAQPSGFVVRTLRGARGGLCPQAGFRRSAAHDQALAPAAAKTSSHRPWSPPIT